MKRSISFVVVVLFSFLFSGCAKDPTEPSEPVIQDPVKTDPPWFRWTTSAGSQFQADSSFAISSGNVIFAFRNGVNHSIEIRVSSMASGTYAINSVSGNQLEYQVGNSHYDGTGTLSITGSSTAKLSGNFECSLTGGTLSTLSGTFSSIPRR